MKGEVKYFPIFILTSLIQSLIWNACFLRGLKDCCLGMKTGIQIHILFNLRRFPASYFGDSGVIFMDDTASCNRSQIVKNFLSENNVSEMEWPAYNSVIHPI